MTVETVILAARWAIGGGLIGVGLLTAWANIVRHWRMYQLRKAGTPKRISGVGCAGSLFFFSGWWIIPGELHPLAILFLLQELPAQFTYWPDEEGSSSDAGGEGGGESAGASESAVENESAAGSEDVDGADDRQGPAPE